ncbi:hypothetical protein B0J17DRAFT_657335 [Rhizoctonia solani]|nr:hypothetical protein B0J17DRAFT_657335 [Rhizoctonia solani]
MQGEDENNDAKSEDGRSNMESEDERSVGNDSICPAEDEVSDEEGANTDEGVSEFGDDFSEDGIEGDVADEDEDALYGF